MERKPKLASVKECTGCFGCIQVCPQGAITKCVNAEGHYCVSINKEKCIGCLKCEEFCKSYKMEAGSNDIVKTEFYCGWAGNDEIRRNGTSGGAFAAFATYIINKGGVVVASIMDDNFCHFCIVNKTEEIYKLQGSKYVQSDISEAYQLIDSVIDSKKVLFVGLGCQCAAILKVFSNRRANLFVVDLVCGGVPTNLLTSKFLQNNQQIEQILSYRSKTQYQLSYLLVNGNVEVDKDCLPIRAFSRETTNRYSCYNCRFAYIHRNSDITIGDIWGCDTVDVSQGVSLAMVHSEKGTELLSNSDFVATAVDPKRILIHNRRIFYGHSAIPMQRRFMVFAFSHFDYSKLNLIYGECGKKSNILLFILKSYKHFLYLLHKKRAVKLALKILESKNEKS